ncbi:hypothetical protein BJ986_001536 [Phycicoccus badiiscoriae]|uniref:YCII-related domain-containing protein n=1 Tax=Pedococcus badiiscoriae TaxID=642776 RepID=A0A852WE33_9MICO|nr:YciI family protein [Pedococcus badiiscoriae]NYG07049.1 hypothetical protein [Pedococcus badiiscoriae]
MTQYIVLLPADEARYASASAQERADLTAAHGEFAQLLAERGHKMTGGAQLTPAGQSRVVRGSALDQVSVTDGPYAESAEQVGGYYVVETSDPADLAKVCGRLLATPFHDAIEIRPQVENQMP